MISKNSSLNTAFTDITNHSTLLDTDVIMKGSSRVSAFKACPNLAKKRFTARVLDDGISQQQLAARKTRRTSVFKPSQPSSYIKYLLFLKLKRAPKGFRLFSAK